MQKLKLKPALAILPYVSDQMRRNYSKKPKISPSHVLMCCTATQIGSLRGGEI